LIGLPGGLVPADRFGGELLFEEVREARSLQRSSIRACRRVRQGSEAIACRFQFPKAVLITGAAGGVGI